MQLRTKGAISEFRAAIWYLDQGYQVFFPSCDGNVVDFVAYKPGYRPELVQVKTAHWIESSGNRYLQLRLGRTRRNSGKRNRVEIRDWDPSNPEDHYDFLIAVYQNRLWRIPKNEFPTGKKTLYLDKTGTGPIRCGYDPSDWLVSPE